MPFDIKAGDTVSIKGINIQIGAEVTGLQAALKDVNSASRDIAKELRQVESLLRFNPENTEALAQKQKLLGDQVSNTATKLKTLKDAQEEVNKQYAQGEISAEQHRAFQRELIKTESQLKHYEKQLRLVNIENDAFKQKMDQLARSLEDAGKKMTRVGDSMTKSLTAPVMGAVTALGAVAVKSAEVADELHKTSQKMGISITSYQELKYWADQNGLSASDLEKAVGRLNQRIGLAKQGNDGYARGLEKLGVNMEAVRAGTVSTGEAMTTAIQTLSQMTEESDKSAVASELFGTKLARELMPVLGDTALSMDDAREAAYKLGLVLDEDGVMASVEFGDRLNDMKSALQAATTEIGMALTPAFEGLVALITDKVAPTLRTFGDRISGLIDGFRNLDPNLQSVLLSLGGLTLAIGPTLSIIGRLTTGIGALLKILGALAPMLATVNLPLVALTAGVAALGFALVTTNRDMSSYYDQALNMAEANRVQAGELENLVKEYKELEGKPDKSQEEHRRLEDVMQDIIKIQPELAKGYDTIDEAIKNNIDTLEAYIETLKLQGEAQIMQAQIEFMNRRNGLEEERNRLLEKRNELESQVSPAQVDALGLGREVAELEKAFVQWSKVVDEGTEEAALALEDQMREIILSVQPDWDLSSGMWGKWVFELQKYAEDATKDSGQIVKDLNELNEALAKIDEELAKGEALDQALIDIRKPYEATKKAVVQVAEEITEEVVEQAEEQNAERERFEERWNKRLFDLTADRLEKLEAEYNEAIALAEKLEADKTAIEEWYALERQKIKDDELAAIKADAEERHNMILAWEARLIEATATEEELLLIQARKRVETIREQMDAELEQAGELGKARRDIIEYWALEEEKVWDDYRDAMTEVLERGKAERLALEEEWSEKLLQQQSTEVENRLRAIDQAEQDAIDLVKARFDDGEQSERLITQIKEYHANLRTQITQAEADEQKRILDEAEEARKAIDAEWTKRLREQSSDEIQILRLQMFEEMKIVENAGGDILKVYQYYNNEIIKAEERRAEEAARIAKAEADAIAAEKERQRQEQESFDARYEQLLFEQSHDRIAILQREMWQEIKIAQDKGADVLAVNKYYNELIRREQQKQADALAKEAEAEAERIRLENEAQEKERLRFEQSWSDRTAALDTTPEAKLQQLEVERERILAQAKELNADIAAVNAYYDEQRGRIELEIAEGQKSFWERQFDALEDPFAKLQQTLANAAGATLDVVKAIASGDWMDAIMTVLMETESFAKAMELIGAVLDPVIALFDAVLAPVINAILGIWNAVLKALSSISIFGWKPFGGLEDKVIDPVGKDDKDDRDKQRSGGRQVSEITGPTRDLLVDLLSPLANFGQIVAPVQDIRNILDARLPNLGSDLAFAGSGGQQIIFEPGAIVVQGGKMSVDEITDDMVDKIGRKLGAKAVAYRRGNPEW